MKEKIERIHLAWPQNIKKIPGIGELGLSSIGSKFFIGESVFVNKYGIVGKIIDIFRSDKDNTNFVYLIIVLPKSLSDMILSHSENANSLVKTKKEFKIGDRVYCKKTKRRGSYVGYPYITGWLDGIMIKGDSGEYFFSTWFCRLVKVKKLKPKFKAGDRAMVYWTHPAQEKCTVFEYSYFSDSLLTDIYRIKTDEGSKFYYVDKSMLKRLVKKPKVFKVGDRVNVYGSITRNFIFSGTIIKIGPESEPEKVIVENSKSRSYEFKWRIESIRDIKKLRKIKKQTD